MVRSDTGGIVGQGKVLMISLPALWLVIQGANPDGLVPFTPSLSLP